MKTAFKLLLVVTLVLAMLTASAGSVSAAECESTIGVIDPACGGGDDDDGGGCGSAGCLESYDADLLAVGTLGVV